MSLLSGPVQAGLLYGLVGVFAVGAVVNLLAPGSIRADYARWGYPPRFNPVTSVLEAVTVGLLLVPSTRMAGLGLGALILCAAIGALTRAREYLHALPAAVLLAVSLMLI